METSISVVLSFEASIVDDLSNSSNRKYHPVGHYVLPQYISNQIHHRSHIVLILITLVKDGRRIGTIPIQVDSGYGYNSDDEKN